MSHKVILDTYSPYNPLPVLLNEPGMRRAMERHLRLSLCSIDGFWNEQGCVERRYAKTFMQSVFSSDTVHIQRNSLYCPDYLR